MTFAKKNDRITTQAQCNQRPNQDSQCRIERASRKSNIHFSICTSNTPSFIHLTIGEGLGIKAIVVFALGWGHDFHSLALFINKLNLAETAT